MFSVIWKGYALKHVSSLRRGASRHCSLAGYLAGKDRKAVTSLHLQKWPEKKQHSHRVNVWLTAFITGAKTPPSRDLAHCPVTGTFWRQHCRAHVAIQSGRLTQFDQHYITVLCAWVVVWVADELGRHDVLLSPIKFPDVVLSKPDFYIWPWRKKLLLSKMYLGEKSPHKSVFSVFLVFKHQIIFYVLVYKHNTLRYLLFWY